MIRKNIFDLLIKIQLTLRWCKIAKKIYNGPMVKLVNTSSLNGDATACGFDSHWGYKNAGVAELVDALDLKSSGQ